MCDLIDKCMLFLLCLPAFPFQKIEPVHVFVCLLAIAVSAGLSAFPAARRAALPVCGLFPLFSPQLCVFFPLLSYDLFSFREASGILMNLPAALLSFGTFLYCGLCRKSFGAEHPFLPHRFRFFFLLICCALAVLLRWKTDHSIQLQRRLLRTKDDDRELQLALRQRNRALLEKQDTEIYTATLRERNRIAREIHDNVGHLLTRAILMVGALKATCQDPSVREPLGQLGDTLNLAMDSIRSSVHDLHDSSVDLEDSLRTMARDFSFCPVSLQYKMSPDLPREVRYSLIAIAREALVNISRHSNATAASITAAEHPGFYQFIVQDNGDASGEDIAGESGIGLENIRTRVSALNGNLQIRTSDGFRIYITIPRR